MIKPAGPEAQRVKLVYVVVDNLNIRSVTDILLFALDRPLRKASVDSPP
jgi:hypothetical protein